MQLVYSLQSTSLCKAIFVVMPLCVGAVGNLPPQHLSGLLSLAIISQPFVFPHTPMTTLYLGYPIRLAVLVSSVVKNICITGSRVLYSVQL